MKRSLRLASSIALVCATVGFDRAHAQVLFSDNFESGAGAWSLTGMWHLENASGACGQLLGPFPSGVQCIRMGNASGTPCNFVGAEAAPTYDLATLNTPISIVGNGTRAWLRYKNRIDTEGCTNVFGDWWDVSRPEISTDGGGSWTPMLMDCHGNAWHKGRTDLTSYIGMDVQLRFSFFAGDAALNDGFGWLIDDVSVRMEPGVPFCDPHNLCPCDNNDGLDAIGGCQSSSGKRGELYGLGTASISQNSVSLHADGLPLGTTALVLQGNAFTTDYLAIGDGILCIGGQILRLGTQQTTVGAISHPLPGGLPLSATATANATYVYQVFYRNAAQYCNMGGTNLTNAYWIAWQP